MIASLVILLLVVLGFLWWWIVQPHGRDALGRDAQLPLFSVRTPGSSLRVIGGGARHQGAVGTPPDAASVAGAPRPAVASANGANGTNGTNGTRVKADVLTPPRPAPPSAPRPSGQSKDGHAPPRSAPAPAAVPMAAADAGEGIQELKWAPPVQPLPASGTVEFLPGRLDVVQGRGVAGQEVRFVRPSRPGERPVVTFGRGEGPLYRHVQLNVPTVSRLHARLSHYADTGGWAVENLSSTNPTVLNGEELPVDAAPRPLREGDRLEMGEVVFTYHAR